MLASSALKNRRAARAVFAKLIEELPYAHRACTNLLLDTCKQVVETEETNRFVCCCFNLVSLFFLKKKSKYNFLFLYFSRMSAKNLAIVLAPNILRPSASAATNHQKMVTDMQDAVQVSTFAFLLAPLAY